MLENVEDDAGREPEMVRAVVALCRPWVVEFQRRKVGGCAELQGVLPVA